MTDLNAVANQLLKNTADTPTKEALWKGALATFEHLRNDHSNYSRSSATYSDDGTSVVVTGSLGQPDGTDRVWRIEVAITESVDQHDGFWGPDGYLQRSDRGWTEDRRAVIDGHHYVIGDERSQGGDFRGMGGRQFTIDFFDGHSVVTHNLWYQGKIPPKWRTLYPDNARFHSASIVETADGGHAWNSDDDMRGSV